SLPNDTAKPVVNSTNHGQNKKVSSHSLIVVSDAISRLNSYSMMLQKLASANNVNDSQSFQAVSAALADASTQLAENDTAAAQEKLANATSLLEDIHSDLYENAQQHNINSTITEDA